MLPASSSSPQTGREQTFKVGGPAFPNAGPFPLRGTDFNSVNWRADRAPAGSAQQNLLWPHRPRWGHPFSGQRLMAEQVAVFADAEMQRSATNTYNYLFSIERKGAGLLKGD
jgi:hypothetical protein